MPAQRGVKGLKSKKNEWGPEQKAKPLPEVCWAKNTNQSRFPLRVRENNKAWREKKLINREMLGPRNKITEA